jgi:hypothetical protein
MRFISLIFLFVVGFFAKAHVPVLLVPLPNPPVASYFLGQSEISRAVYSEITRRDDFFVAQFYVKAGAEQTLLQIFSPDCPRLPQYEAFQPSGMIIRGELPWQEAGEKNHDFIQRLTLTAVAKAESSYTVGSRPKFYEEFAKQSYWVGGEWRGSLSPGLYSLVIYDPSGKTGNFTVGLNEKEAWIPDLFKYADMIVKKISKRICSPKGYTGHLRL